MWYRVIAENLGARVDWSSSEKRIPLVKITINCPLWIGKSTAQENGQSLAQDVEQEITNDCAFVPLRFVAADPETYDAEVKWDEITQTAMVIVCLIGRKTTVII